VPAEVGKGAASLNVRPFSAMGLRPKRKDEGAWGRMTV